jgi:hypothetical protein
MKNKDQVRLRALAGAVLMALALAIAGCGESESASEPTTETVIVKTVTEEAPAAPRESSAAGESGGSSDDKPSGGGGGGGGDITVPDVVGKDHQLAQDTMQSAGLYSLSEEDATGQGRMMILDRGWVVVEQDPPAGTRVNEDTTIILRSKKKGE